MGRLTSEHTFPPEGFIKHTFSPFRAIHPFDAVSPPWLSEAVYFSPWQETVDLSVMNTRLKSENKRNNQVSKNKNNYWLMKKIKTDIMTSVSFPFYLKKYFKSNKKKKVNI